MMRQLISVGRELRALASSLYRNHDRAHRALPAPGAAGAHGARIIADSNGTNHVYTNYLSDNLARRFFNQTYDGHRFGLPTGWKMPTKVVHCDIVLNADGSYGHVANSQGQDDFNSVFSGGDQGKYFITETLPRRSWPGLLMVDVKLFGRVVGGASLSNAPAPPREQWPSFRAVNCCIASIGCPDPDLISPWDDWAWATDPSAHYAVEIENGIAFTVTGNGVGPTTITSAIPGAYGQPQPSDSMYGLYGAQPNTRALAYGALSLVGNTADYKIRIGKYGNVPVVLNYTACVQDETTGRWVFSGITGWPNDGITRTFDSDVTANKGDRICQGLDDHSGLINLNRWVAGPSKGVLSLYSGSSGAGSYAATGAWTLGECESNISTDLIFQNCLHYCCSKQPIRMGGSARVGGAKNIRFANHVFYAHPGADNDNPGAPLEHHFEMVRNDNTDNSALGSAKNFPQMEYVYIAHSFGTAAWICGIGTGSFAKNVGARNVIWSYNGTGPWFGPEAIGCYVGFSWVDPNSTSKNDGAPDTFYEECRNTDTNALVFGSVPNP